MTKQRARTISRPFDARHVGGVSIPGATIPLAGIERSSTSSGLEPDETPSHTFVATGNIEVPRRSNTIANTLSRPSLRLKTSISRLRGRSSSNSPDTYRRKETDPTADAAQRHDMPVQSLRKKPSSSRLWQRVHHESPTEKESVPEPLEKDSPVLKLKASMSRLTSSTSTSSSDQHMPTRVAAPSIQRIPSQKKLPPVRPKRADSGTAIDFDHVPAEERPLGFKEILAVSSYAERMALYKKTREYWAHADHGLGDWVEKVGSHRPLTFQV